MKRTIAFVLSVLVFLPSVLFAAQAKSTCTVTLSQTSYAYDGNSKTPSVTVTFGGKTLRKGTDYSVSYPAGRVNVGSYTVTVTLKGSYSGKKTASFRIIPSAVEVTSLTALQKSVTVKWKTQSKQVTGYKIKWSSSGSFSSYKTVTVKDKKISRHTISGLKGNTNYYVRIRSYKAVGDKAYYSDWSPIMCVRTPSAASAPAQKGHKVSYYVTPKGKSYHFSKGCAGSNAVKVSSSKAAEYKPCGTCVR